MADVCVDRAHDHNDGLAESAQNGFITGSKWANGGIKSKERVSKFAEVFTPDWMVQKMCDLVSAESEDAFTVLTKTWLEPACGTGNFLVEIFRRKLLVCETSLDGLVALGSIFGIDIQQDNVEESRQRLKEMFVARFGWTDAVAPILERNIVCGDFLTGLTSDGKKIWFLADQEDYWNSIRQRQKKELRKKRKISVLEK